MWSRITATLLLAACATQALAAVEREDIIVLGADGLHYTSYKTLRSDLAERVLYLGPDEAPSDAVFIVPADYESTPLDDGGTRLHFQSGSFALMNTGAFDAEIERNANNVYVFNSWDGVTRGDGHLGKWNAPDDFASFSYTWVLPRNIDILAYEANRAGTWEKRENTLNWTGKQVNDIAFTIRYRVNPAAEGARAPQVADNEAPAQPPQNQQPQQPAPAQRPSDMAAVELETAPPGSFDGTPPSSFDSEQPASDAELAQESAAPDASPRSVQLASVVTLADGRPQVTARGRRVLRRLAGALATDRTQSVVIHGPTFADSRDTGGSVAQAARVSDFLAAHGVAEARIDIRAGEREDNATGDEIEITVAPGGLLDEFADER
jgi:outer membrane protein OmpA-like peptidoglycan-associated protein